MPRDKAPHCLDLTAILELRACHLDAREKDLEFAADEPWKNSLTVRTNTGWCYTVRVCTLMYAERRLQRPGGGREVRRLFPCNNLIHIGREKRGRVRVSDNPFTRSSCGQ